MIYNTWWDKESAWIIGDLEIIGDLGEIYN